jgi:prepilin-type N-terminal cleavage/methylation domain-containing protein
VKRQSGFTLVEVVVTILVVGVGLVATMRALPVLLKTSKASHDAAVAHELAATLLAEIALLPFEDPDNSGGFGPESDERTAVRADFDDIDDYHDWTASPPQRKDGSPEPDGDGYARSVTVTSVDPSDFQATVTPGSSDAKLIGVSVSRVGSPTVTLTTVRLKGANPEDTN